ncbi:non-homologous end joining protein Ku [Candidatus Berkiella aquae]|uniref:Non-homologous end joining protein Ku n=1 Tax=Candidatus Berkiella aquae TaxID=295108 RepID=A0A0Q9Z0N9_9GAMM|nr:Ku protein [Candidatus Berkiella aquae]MCS5712042.1 Ku protein [Candidatus Berkiella aquae]
MPNRKRVPKSSKEQKNKAEKPHYDRRTIWRGYITFGLVNIPVMLYSAEKPQQEIHFKLLDKRNHAGIRYSRINEETGKEVAWQDIVKGYEYEPGNYAILTPEDLDEIAKENLKAIEIEDFIDLEQLEPYYFEKPYFLLPDKRGEKGYVLLRETLRNTHKVGIARVMIRTHQYLAAVMVQDNAIVINTMRYPQEVKTPSEVDVPEEPISSYKISKKEFDIAKQLVDTMTVKWDPARYTNDYREELMHLIDEKIASGGKKAIKHEKEAKIKHTNVIDFMELLKKSVKEKKTPKATKKTTTKATKHKKK